MNAINKGRVSEVTDQERLEEIQDRDISILHGTKLWDDWLWLRQKAESLLGTKHKYGFKDMYWLCNRDYANLHSEKERYKQALEFYADEKNHTELRGDHSFGDVFYDEGKIARQVLKEVNDDGS